MCEKAFSIYENHIPPLFASLIYARAASELGRVKRAARFLCMGIYHEHSRTALEPELLPLFVINTCVLVAQLDRVPRAHEKVFCLRSSCAGGPNRSLSSCMLTHTQTFPCETLVCVSAGVNQDFFVVSTREDDT